MNTCLALCIAAATTTVSAAAPEPKLDPAARTMILMRAAAALLTGYVEAGPSLAESEQKLVLGSTVGTRIGPELARWLPVKDGWGHPLRFAFLDDEVLVFSFGADGQPDVRYDELADPTRAERPLPAIASSPDRDIILINAEFVQKPETPRSSTERAMREIRSIATAIESFAVDNDRYPGPTSGLKTIAVLASDVEPTYIKELPRVDPWGEPYWVWSNGKSYIIVTGGSDATLDRGYLAGDTAAPDLQEGVETSDTKADIVFFDGQFVRYPHAKRKPGE
ncbi:MAG TPA: type II secretion system protein GspG [Candidatus Polarisedimenticolaceae bacterium]|nr:type II secretion system protein GspG [Candidatus Polarisedimenticolaceae bacterium]